MNDEQRRELAQRKEAAKERREVEAQRLRWEARLAAIAVLTSVLEGAGAQFEIVETQSDQRWVPAWVPCGYSEVPWDLAPTTEFAEYEVDWQGSAATATNALARLSEVDQPVLLIYRWPQLAVRLATAWAIRFMGEAIEAARRGSGDLWVSHPGGGWMIRLTPGFTLVSVPLSDGVPS